MLRRRRRGGGPLHPRGNVDAAKVALVAMVGPTLLPFITESLQRTGTMARSDIEMGRWTVRHTAASLQRQSPHSTVSRSVSPSQSNMQCSCMKVCLSRPSAAAAATEKRRPSSEGRGKGRSEEQTLYGNSTPHSTARRTLTADFLSSPSHNFLRSRQPLE